MNENENERKSWLVGGEELRERIHRITNELRDSIKHLPDALLRVPAKGERSSDRVDSSRGLDTSTSANLGGGRATNGL